MRKQYRQLHITDVELKVVQSLDEPGLFRISVKCETTREVLATYARLDRNKKLFGSISYTVPLSISNELNCLNRLTYFDDVPSTISKLGRDIDFQGSLGISLPYITNHMDTSRKDNVVNSRFLLINKP